MIADVPNATYVDALTPDECVQVADRITQLKPHWIKRDDFGLFTLGPAAYQDARDPVTFNLPGPQPQKYYRLAQQYNPLLLDHFPDLFAAVEGALASHLKRAVRYYTSCALPGFHIYLASEFYASPEAHFPHVDRQYRGLIWDNVEAIQFDEAISFTLPIELPQSGGGLNIWDLNLFDVENWSKAEAKERIRQAPVQKHDYRPGRMLVHRGHALHRAAAWRAEEGERRITLQGHGLFFDDVWNLYW